MIWPQVELNNATPQDILQYNIELNRRLRYYFSHIPALLYGSSVTFSKISSSSATLGEISSTGSITANTLTASSATFTKVRSSSAIFGNSTSYSQFESDGTLILYGDAKTWNDEQNDVVKLKISGVGISEDSTDATINFDTLANLSDFLYTNVQFNHSRYLIGRIEPHIHAIQNSTIIPNMLIGYRIQYHGGEINTSWTYLRMNTPVNTYVAGTTIHQVYETSAGIAVSSSRSNLSDILQIKIYRDNANASGIFSSTDNLGTTVKTLSFDIHYQIDSLGSRQEYVK